MCRKKNKASNNVCCGCCPNTKDVANDEIGDEKIQNAVLAEKGFTESVNNVKGSLSWTSSTTLGTAMSASIYFAFADDSTAAGIVADWLYVVILILIACTIGFVCRDSKSDAAASVGAELEQTVPAKKAALAKKWQTANENENENENKLEIKEEKNENDNKNDSNNNNDNNNKKTTNKKENAKAIASFVEKETDSVTENLASLLSDTFANTVALAMSDAAFNTFLAFGNSEATTIARWLYACIFTFLSIRVSLYAGDYLDSLEITTYDYVNDIYNKNSNKIKEKEKWTNEKVISYVKFYAARKRIVKLVDYAFGLTMAWAWRNAFKYAILDAYSVDTTELIGLWIYCVFATILVTYINTLTTQYYCFYPKTNDVPLQFETQERNIISKTFQSALKKVVGIAWYDVFVESAFVIFTGASQVACLWIVYFIVLFIVIFGEYYWDQIWLKYEMKLKGAIKAVFDSNDRLFDPKQELSFKYKSKERFKTENRQRVEFTVLWICTLFKLLFDAWSVATGNLASAGIKLVIFEIWDGVYTPDSETGTNSNITWSLWVAWLGVFGVCFIVLIVISKLEDGYVATRRTLMEKIKNENEMKEKKKKKEENKNDNANDDDNDNDEELQVGQSQGQTTATRIAVDAESNENT